MLIITIVGAILFNIITIAVANKSMAALLPFGLSLLFGFFGFESILFAFGMGTF
jgi:hypothetical protein